MLDERPPLSRVAFSNGQAVPPRVAYFSMEIALESEIPTYSGGLGILAGDMLRSAADLRLPLVAVTMVHRNGYFTQRLDAQGRQREEPDAWYPEARCSLVDAQVAVEIEGRSVEIVAWRYDVIGHDGGVVPVLLLDTDLPQNAREDRDLVGSLYGGDDRYRLAQECVLGFGGFALLERLGLVDGIAAFHMNEGHSALLVAAAVERYGDLARVRPRCTFTTHTPVPAGHDRFSPALARAVLGERRERLVASLGAVDGDTINMSRLALAGSHYTNAVAMLHRETSRALFPGADIHAITNGVHAGRWTAPPFAALFDRHLPGWRGDNAYLRHAVGIATDEIARAHARAKRDLFDAIPAISEAGLDPSNLTIGFARRAAAYKRGALVFRDLERLRHIARSAGPLQFVFGGKSHPKDDDGKAVIREIHDAAQALGDAVRVVYVENYEMATAAHIVAGVDVWLNTPRRPLEASGTSGMKAALNGVPSFSTLDGWWVEGCIEGVTGWAIGDGADDASDDADAAALYDKLERVIAPVYYREPERFTWIRRNAVALNGSYFNTQRMVEQYALGAYGLAATAARASSAP